MKLTKPLILASGSPRRKQILHDTGFDFSVEVRLTTEEFSNDLAPQLVPEFLAKQKAEQFQDKPQSIVLAADTVVIVNDKILNKPHNEAQARQMLEELSGRSHQVVTGVCMGVDNCFETFADSATVYFKPLSPIEIDYYIRTCKPFDKAGGYGVQDFIGMVGIPSIEGSFYTVMGLPIHKVYEALQKYMVW